MVMLIDVPRALLEVVMVLSRPASSAVTDAARCRPTWPTSSAAVSASESRSLSLISSAATSIEARRSAASRDERGLEALVDARPASRRRARRTP